LELILLGLAAFTVVLTLAAAAFGLLWVGFKLLFSILLLPAKLLGALAGGVAELVLFPVKLLLLLFLLAFLFTGLVVLPLFLPILLICAAVYLVAACL
jgi:hypothetical protein